MLLNRGEQAVPPGVLPPGPGPQCPRREGKTGRGGDSGRVTAAPRTGRPLRARSSRVQPPSAPWRPPAGRPAGPASVLHQRRSPRSPSGARLSLPRAGPQRHSRLLPTRPGASSRVRCSPGRRPFSLAVEEARPAPGCAEPEAKARFPARLGRERALPGNRRPREGDACLAASGVRAGRTGLGDRDGESAAAGRRACPACPSA